MSPVEDYPQDTSEPVPVDFDLDAWIGGAQIAQHSVVIYGRPDLVAAMEDTERRIIAARAAADGALSDPEVDRLEAEGDSLLKQFEASKSTWYVAGLSPEKATEIQAKHPLPDLGDDPTDAQRAAYREAVAVQNLHWLAEAVVKIVTPAGEKYGVTFEQMSALRGRLGELQIGRLKSATMSAQFEEPEVPAPFSRRRSGPDQT